MNRRYESRLEKKLENQTKRYIIFTIIGIIIVVIIVVKFGIPLILGISSFSSSQNSSFSTNSKSTAPTYIAPPTLNSLPNATKNNTITITGNASNGETIKLYNNNNFVTNISTNTDGSFTFTNISLTQGNNQFSAKAEKNLNDSNNSNTISISYLNKPPNLTISSPTDGSTFSKDQNPITIKGTTDPNTTVTVNGYQATIDENGNYNYILTLQNGGDTHITIESTDQAGNKTDKQIKVTYNP